MSAALPARRASRPLRRSALLVAVLLAAGIPLYRFVPAREAGRDPAMPQAPAARAPASAAQSDALQPHAPPPLASTAAALRTNRADQPPQTVRATAQPPLPAAVQQEQPLRGDVDVAAHEPPAPATARNVARDTALDEGIMELVAERLPPATVVVLVDSAGSVLLPLEHVLHFLGLGSPGAAREIRVPRLGAAVARVDTSAFTIVLPSGRVQLAPAEMPRRGDVVFLRAERLETLLEGRVVVDFAALSVTFARDVPFPAQQRVLAEQRRAMVLARQRWLEERAERSNVPYDALTGGAIADWEVVTGSLDPAQLTIARGRLGAAVLGGDLGFGGALETGRNVEDRFRDGTAYYQRVFPRNPYLSQARVGDVLTNGLFSRQVRGLELSNRPFLRTPELSAVLLQPDLPPGWEYEVFQGNQLIGYSTIGGTDPVAVPLRSGTTPLQVRMYGPAGEEVVRTLLYQTPVWLLRDGVVEYAAGGGRCAVGCDEFVHADVRYGVTPLVTAGGGLELVTDSLGTALRPYLVYAISSGTRATAELTYMPFSLYSANLALFVRDGSAAYVRGSLARPGFSPISIVSGESMRWDVEANWDERLEQARFFSQLRLGVASVGSAGELQRFRVSATGAFRNGYLEARYDHDRTPTQRRLLTTRASIFTPFALRGRTLRPLLSTGVGITDSGIGLAEAAVSLQPTAASLLTAGVQWNRGTTQPALTLGYTVRTRAALAAVRAASSAAGTRSSSASLSGSAALGRDGELSLHPASRTGYAGISGIVFVDHDGDGLFTPGDEAIGEAYLLIGGQRVATSGDGTFHAWGLQPYQPTSIAIDSARTADPSLTTMQSEIIVRPVPNMARAIHIPLVRTRELIGSVSASAPDISTGSLTIDVTELGSGETTTTVTFSDGFFYISRLRPGRYRISVADASLRAVGAVSAAAPLEFTIPARGDDVAVELPPLPIRRP